MSTIIDKNDKTTSTMSHEVNMQLRTVYFRSGSIFQFEQVYFTNGPMFFAKPPIYLFTKVLLYMGTCNENI